MYHCLSAQFCMVGITAVVAYTTRNAQNCCCHAFQELSVGAEKLLKTRISNETGHRKLIIVSFFKSATVWLVCKYGARMFICDLMLQQKTPIIYLIQLGMVWEEKLSWWGNLPCTQVFVIWAQAFWQLTI